MRKASEIIIKSSITLIVVLLFCFGAQAQFSVTIKLTGIPSSHKDESIFLAGSFNGWNPGQAGFQFSSSQQPQLLLSNIPAGKYQFKFTRGSWEKAECTAAGADIPNRELQLSSDTSVSFFIGGWKDDFMPAKKSTASANVHIMDSAFFMPQLNRSRRIWIYLPQGYSGSKKSYPVLYMHDGQNLFDETTAPFGEWGVDENLDSLTGAGAPACIVVGIDNGEKRMNEYNPYELTLKEGNDSMKFSPEGDAYIDFIAKTLKPYLDKHYRTLPSKESTLIAGSSMGGLISYYAMLKYPLVFGKAGVFSPAFWTAPGINHAADSLAGKLNGKLFFYMGGQEGYDMVDDMKLIQEITGKNSSAMIYSVIDPSANHNEAAWRKWFPEFYKWMMQDGYNGPVKVDE